MKRNLSIIVALMITVVGCSAQQPAAQVNSALPAPVVHVNVNALQAEALSILKNGLSDNNAYLRSYAIESVVETQQRQFTPQVMQLLKDRTVGVRFAAATAAGDMQCAGCREQVQPLLKDENESVRIAAAYALAMLNRPEYADTIRTSLKSADETARANAALLIGKLGNRNDVPLLYETLYDAESTDKVRMQTVESIARLGDERMYRSKLWALQISKFGDDRVMGIRGMGALNTPESRNAILTMLTDDIPEVRLAAAEQLARLGDKRGEEEVFNYFQTQPPPDLNQGTMANSMAVMAIGRLDSPRLSPYLAKAMKSQSAYLRIIAAKSVMLLAK